MERKKTMSAASRGDSLVHRQQVGDIDAPRRQRRANGLEVAKPIAQRETALLPIIPDRINVTSLQEISD